ncbi:MAG: hypothetical protein MJ246_02975 [Clostridia bacterium]|nr:hypothetical protein [Clostridia bacterium]
MLGDLFDYLKKFKAEILFKDKEKYLNAFYEKGNIEIIKHVYIQQGEKFE